MTIPTASQTVGPYFKLGLDWPDEADLARLGCQGEVIEVQGRITDAAGDGVGDAILEIWQANAEGRYHHPADRQNTPLDPHFRGRGRIEVDAGGVFRFRTVKPGRVPATDGGFQAPHICLQIFARGLLKQLHTRIYFSDEADANNADPVLSLVPPERRATLIAAREGSHYTFPIRLQAEDPAKETLFLEY